MTAGPPAADWAGLLAGDWAGLLARVAGDYARVAMANIDREYPVIVLSLVDGPDAVPGLPRAEHPVFFGSLDWHSCVEMHWVLVRLLRLVPGAVPGAEIRAFLDRQLTADGLAAETAWAAGPDATWERPYGWGWALALAHEAASWDDPDGRGWAAALGPLAGTLRGRFLDWLDGATYPVRHGVHANSAFGLTLALPWARAQAEAGDPVLRDAITAAARRWFGGDAGYPAQFEPSGHDFLSPALTEAELMACVLPDGTFPGWLDGFLPGLAGGQPAALFTPAVVSDASDGQVAHLHGLNASRAWCWRRIAASLPADDPRVPVALDAARRHAAVSLPHAVGSHYMVEHWLAAYAVLLLS